ncbi:Beta-galactosidase C-terminal domain [Streptomyces sp. NPDC014995]|uniref:Beta-galactosidase C-terminal domain n=1 Tax=Streptomyces sp. NPDC014995 TaxID=3364936 RepID=UPI003703156D
MGRGHIDHGGAGARVRVACDGTELLTGRPLSDGTVTVPPGGVAVVRQPRRA